jgi:hypothetical protein
MPNFTVFYQQLNVNCIEDFDEESEARKCYVDACAHLDTSRAILLAGPGERSYCLEEFIREVSSEE